MANWIDQAALWTISASSIYFMIYVLTDGSLPVAVVFTFVSVLLMRHLVSKLPDKRWIRRSDRATYAKNLLREWALMRSEEALKIIREYLPELLIPQTNTVIRLVQRMPDSAPFDANCLLDIWRNSSDISVLHLIVTAPVQAEAHTIAASLNHPSVRITDSTALIRMLVKRIREIPAKKKTTGRYLPSKASIARYIQSIKPARTLCYSLFFAGSYLFNRSWIHLTAACLMLFLTLTRLIFVRQRPLC